MNYRGHPEQAEGVVQRITDAGGRATAVRADVTDPEDIGALVQSCVREFGRLDILVNNAGVEHKMPFLETPLDVWSQVIAVNLTGPWLGCQEAAKQMVSQGDPGRIINVSSVHEDLAHADQLPVLRRQEWCAHASAHDSRRARPHGITVNNIAPGPRPENHGISCNTLSSQSY